MTTISDGLAAYRIFAQAEGKSPRTVRWTETSVSYFRAFLGDQQDVSKIGGDDLRRFIIALREWHKFASHPFTRPMEATISLQSIETYARAVRAFFGFLHREGFIKKNPMQQVKMPKVPYKVVPTFSGHDVEKLLCQPNKQSNRGFRDYAIILTLVDTAARMEKVISAYGKSAGMKRCYPHKLRHTSAVLYLRNDGDPFSLQKKLGHTSLAMTRHYSNLADSDVRAQHLRFGVADRLKA